MSIVLLGSTGMLGRAWICELTNRTVDFLEPGRINVRNIDLPLVPGDVVVNCIGYTDVDKAEDEEWVATEVNGVFVGRLARHCKEKGAKLVHYSTDYVFDGSSTKYQPHHDPNPINAYGRSKFVGEKFLEFSGCEYLNIRTSWLYAPWGHNFVRTMLSLSKDRDSLAVVNDQFGCPTSCFHLVSSTLSIIEQEGTWHITDGGSCSWFEFAKEIVEKRCTVEPCSTNEFPRPAPRPHCSILAVEQTESVLGTLPSWRQNLSEVLSEIRGL